MDMVSSYFDTPNTKEGLEQAIHSVNKSIEKLEKKVKEESATLLYSEADAIYQALIRHRNNKKRYELLLQKFNK